MKFLLLATFIGPPIWKSENYYTHFISLSCTCFFCLVLYCFFVFIFFFVSGTLLCTCWLRCLLSSLLYLGLFFFGLYLAVFSLFKLNATKFPIQNWHITNSLPLILMTFRPISFKWGHLLLVSVLCSLATISNFGVLCLVL